MRDDLALRVDRRRNAIVRGTHEKSTRLERAHARDLQMLMGRGRVAVPGIIGHIDEQGCLPQYAQLLAAEGVLVANGETELLSRGA